MGMFGIKPARIGDRTCDCSACVQLRQVSIGTRIGQGAAVLVMVVLGLGGAVLVASLIVWGIVAVVSQL
jgi:hypothetical protein